MPRLRLVISYVGTDYCGWQTQATKKAPHPPTVQEILETEISRICCEKINLIGSGRTDSGVHAAAQNAHCDIPESKLNLDWQMALNTSLPRDIRIISASYVEDTFHARNSAIAKAYDYRLWTDRRYTPPWLYPFVWDCGPLDLAAMDAAIPHLVGTHDFSAVQNAGTDLKTTTRTLFSIDRTGPDGGDPMLVLRFKANGFLKQMVRNLTGLLVACGRGKFDPAAIPALLESRDRRRAPVTAPPRGLCMAEVIYPDGIREIPTRKVKTG
ncbi:MAG: tRNA pseudouridine(38-40) synthase TruA [Mailhella sp.]|nr:tRNA pseudouridine(38-40) synthase TruA [Mailhella sp.]